MSELAISMKVITCPRASKPKFRTRVDISELRQAQKGKRKRDGSDAVCKWFRLYDESRHFLSVSTVDTWTLDMLRLVLHELAAYIPAHEDHEATATVIVKGKRPVKVALIVEARGWRASCDLSFHHSKLQAKDFRTNEDYMNAIRTERFDAEQDFSEPMLACLRELSDRSPLALSAIDDPMDREPTNYVPRRSKGIEVA